MSRQWLTDLASEKKACSPRTPKLALRLSSSVEYLASSSMHVTSKPI